MSQKAIAIYGPPGTGKTRRLMDIMAKLKDERRIPSHEIGFFAFTRAAADEAKRRLNVTSSKTMRTLHSLAYEAAQVSKVQVVDTLKLRQFGDFIGIPMNGKSAVGFENVEEGDEYMSVHNFAVARQIPVAQAFDQMPGLALNRTVAEMVSKSYTEWKRRFGWVDFNDMILRYLADPINVGAKYLFLDEAQDLSPLQWAMVAGLAEHAECIWLAGDDDQAIYEWSGADPHGMAKYHYEGNQRILDQSYRVPQLVHAIANRVISRVGQRVEKRYKPREERGTVRRYGDLDPVALPKGDTLMLYRNHTSRRDIEAWLMEHAIPYTAAGPFPSHFQGKWANATRAWFRLRRGEHLNDAALQLIARIAPGVAANISRGDFRFAKDAPSRHFHGVPEDVASYLGRVDLNLPPTTRISTIHASKGAEADRVILMNAMGERTYEEMNDSEHRVWYVAVTRARHQLDIVDGANAYDL
ncbi:MAG: ATP-dependent helicase [Acidobacteria bacterium]|nr:ATP-dependent helicase [Acidobacteriota bacterium]